eukprot:TRINITY_DN2102_c1_g1_i5.p1 TRINITY_DN2102_c1_g1~~TRINITY_DN2102_c1_g1_i5.p1  ORF type:complete len:1178 (+),score=353.24 TRINITY_DN2102_c1_g1_i5:149-3682(+)
MAGRGLRQIGSSLRRREGNQGGMELQDEPDDDVGGMFDDGMAASQSGHGAWARRTSEHRPQHALPVSKPTLSVAPIRMASGSSSLQSPPDAAPQAPAMRPPPHRGASARVRAAAAHGQPALSGREISGVGLFGPTPGESQSPLWSPGIAKAHQHHITKLLKHGAVAHMVLSSKRKDLEGASGGVDEVEDVEFETQWMDVLREPFSRESSGKISEESMVRALLKLGFAPAVLRELRDNFDVLESAIHETGEPAASGQLERPLRRSEMFSNLCTGVQGLLGLRAETVELLLTTRAFGSLDRVFDDDMDLSQAPTGDEPFGASVSVSVNPGARLRSGSRGKKVVTYQELLSNILIFTPIGSQQSKLDLLMDMFDRGVERVDRYHFSVRDTTRLLRWLVKEALTEEDDEEIVDSIGGMIEEDYLRALMSDHGRTEDREDADRQQGGGSEPLVTHDTLMKEGYHRLVLQEVLLSADRGGGALSMPRNPIGLSVIVFGVRNKELNGRLGTIEDRVSGQRDKFLVQFEEGIGTRQLRGINLRYDSPQIHATLGQERAALGWGLYLPLNLNIRPRTEGTVRENAPVGWIAVWKWCRRRLWLIVFLVSILVLFLVPFYARYLHNEELHALLGNVVAVSGGSAWALRYLLVLCIMSGCGVFWRKVPMAIAPDPRKLPWLHAFLACGVLFFTVVHVLSASITVARITDKNATHVNTVLGTSFDGPTGAEIISSTPCITGMVMSGALIGILAGSVAHRDSKWFHFTHLLVWVLVLASIAHPLEGWFEWRFGSAIWYSVPFIMMVTETYLRCTGDTPNKAEKVKEVKGAGGATVGIEFRFRRPVGPRMIQQQAGHYIEIRVPAISSKWQPATPVSAPEIETEQVRVQYVARARTPFLKSAEYKCLTDEESLKQVSMRGPFGLAACDIICEENGWRQGGDASGKMILAADEEGMLHLTGVLNDIYLTLANSTDMHRPLTSRLHSPLVEMLCERDKRGTPKLGMLIVSTSRSLEGYKRFTDVIMRLLLLIHGRELKEDEDDLQPGQSFEGTGADTFRVPIENGGLSIAVRIHCTQAASAGMGVDAYRRMKQLAKLGRGAGKAYQERERLLQWHTFYGAPDWNNILRKCKYDWLGETVDVLHWGEGMREAELASACRDNTDRAPPKAGSEQQPQRGRTVFRFHHGHTPSSAKS